MPAWISRHRVYLPSFDGVDIENERALLGSMLTFDTLLLPRSSDRMRARSAAMPSRFEKLQNLCQLGSQIEEAV